MSRINNITIGPRRQDEVTYAVRLEPNPLREQIQADVEAYLARGGVILPAPQSPRWRVKQSRDGGSWVTRPSALDKYVTKSARQASAFRPGKESAKPVRASSGAIDQSAAVAQEHRPCEPFPIARA
jgi:hypothetical protein